MVFDTMIHGILADDRGRGSLLNLLRRRRRLAEPLWPTESTDGAAHNRLADAVRAHMDYRLLDERRACASVSRMHSQRSPLGFLTLVPNAGRAFLPVKGDDHRHGRDS
jgi:hypothetical protein